MPTLYEIENKRKKGFKKREYRPWDIEGSNANYDPNIESSSPPIDNLNEKVFFINPDVIRNWEFHDRPASELGDIESLAKEFKEIGQQQPCIVRPVSHDNYKYELIVGERRWHAAKLAQLDLKVIVKIIADSEAAIIQASENLNRKDLSDYARGISYSNLIEKGILEQKDLIEKLNLSKQQVSRLLSYSKIPDIIINTINDMSKVSARTAEQIKQLSCKGERYINAILKFADKLRDGKLGHEKLTLLVENEINKALSNFNPHYAKNEKVFSTNGLPIFTWRFNKNANVSIDFSPDAASLLYEKKADHNDLTTLIREYMERSLSKVK